MYEVKDGRLKFVGVEFIGLLCPARVGLEA